MGRQTAGGVASRVKRPFVFSHLQTIESDTNGFLMEEGANERRTHEHRHYGITIEQKDIRTQLLYFKLQQIVFSIGFALLIQVSGDVVLLLCSVNNLQALLHVEPQQPWSKMAEAHDFILG